jgi:hypothetical protein
MRTEFATFGADVLRSRLNAPAPRSLVRSLLYLLVVALPFASVIGSEAMRFVPYGNDDHAALSLEIATNRALCGRTSMVSPQHRMAPLLREDQRRMNQPVRTIAEEQAGSLQRYCDSVTFSVVNGENSLMLLERWILGVAPNASVRTIGQATFGLEIAMYLAFTFGLLVLGASLMSCAALFACALSITVTLAPHRYTGYPLMLPVLLLQVGVCAIALRWHAARRPTVLAGLLFATGGLSAFTVNLRTDMAPYVSALWVAFLVYVLSDRVRAAINWRTDGALLGAAFCAGWLLFSTLFIGPLPAKIDGSKPTAHPIAHPLVLSLAYPSNEFASSQGIEWDDDVGYALARRVDPDVPYLGSAYERALFRFYARLWVAHPREMAGLYLFKSTVAGRSIIRNLTVLAGADLWKVLFLPLQRVPSGLAILALFAGVTLWSARVAWRDRAGLWAIVAVVAMVGLMAQIEASVLVSQFVLQYQAIELFALAVVFVSAYQLLIELAAHAVEVHARDEDARTATVVGCVAGTLYGVLAVAYGYRSVGGLFLSDVVVVTAVAYGVLAGLAYLVFRAVCPRRTALALVTAASALWVGRPNVAELLSAVAVIALFLSVARAIAGPADSRMRLIVYSAMAAGVAMAAGANVLIILAMVATGWVLSMAGRSARRPMMKSFAIAAAALSCVAWVGGTTAAGYVGPRAGAQSTITATPELLNKTDAPGGLAYLVRARVVVARLLMWLSLIATPILIVVLARRQMRLGLWLFACWAWFILMAPADGQPAAIVGVVLVGCATAAALGTKFVLPSHSAAMRFTA